MALFEIGNFKGQDRVEVRHIAANGLDAVFLPGPNFGRDVIEDRADVFLRHVTSHLEVESRIVHQNHRVWLPFGNLLFAVFYAAQDGSQMKQNGDEAHVGQMLVVAQ